jgi:multicomponent Na+:H+ antiporter subunit B
VKRGPRLAVFLVGAAGLAVLLGWGIGGLPPFGVYRGPYGDIINRSVVPERHTTEAVGAVVMDYRGFDTLGEEFILLTSVAGVALLLRTARDEEEVETPDEEEEPRGTVPTTDAVAAAGLMMLGPTVVLGLSLVAHGHITPGGGFQGGAVLAAGAILSFLAGRYTVFRRVTPPDLVDLAEGTGAGGFVVVGLLGLVSGAAFLANVLPLGEAGTLLSSGTLPLLNLTVGLEVAAGFVLIVSEFLEEALAVRPKRGR